MAHATLARLPSTSNGTFGAWAVDGVPTCVTVELPWNNNDHDTSCIPPGTYVCARHVSPKFPNGDTWELQNVPGRMGILIHAANDISDLEGCIGVGTQFGVVGLLPAVLNSRTMLANLNTILPETFTLTITQGD